MKHTINIDELIKIVAGGGIIKTGVDIYDSRGLLLLEKDVPVSDVKPLQILKRNGIVDVEIDPDRAGGVWTGSGSPLEFASPPEQEKPEQEAPGIRINAPTAELEQRIETILEIRKTAKGKFTKAKENIKGVLTDIKATGGEFEYAQVEETVTDLFSFSKANDGAFSFLSKEIFSYDDYLYNHCVNVCTLGLGVLRHFNQNFSTMLGKFLSTTSMVGPDGDPFANSPDTYAYYDDSDLIDMASGYFLHDVGKILIPDEILNKPAKLTDEEFAIVKTHSFEKGVEILEKNKLRNPFIQKIVTYHHAPLFEGEFGCYPSDRAHNEIPPYVGICKLVDIYDAMTSKRSYKNAFNPISVVTEIFRKFAQKDRMLQMVLHAFVKSVGIYPPGSVVTLRSGQLAYVVESTGPVIIPFTDTRGEPYPRLQDFLKLSELTGDDERHIDKRIPLMAPVDAFNKIPDYLKKTLES